MIAARADGLGTCCIGFSVAALNMPEVKQQLGIPSDVHAFASMIVGVPPDEHLPTPRKPPMVLRWIKP